MRTPCSTLLPLLASLLTVPPASPADPHEWFTPEHATAELLILGTFHFKDAGLDSYKPEIDIDILSPQRQEEVSEVLDLLAAFRPNKVLIEWKVGQQAVTDERYAAYRSGELDLGSNEVYQIGFRLAKRLELDRVHNVDVLGRPYDGLPEDLEEYARSLGQEDLVDGPWPERYTSLYRADDHAKARRSLREQLLYLNSPERLRVGHGRYVLRELAVGDAGSYPAVDALTGWWYNRNLRIYANVLRNSEPGDRLLLLIGAGHVPILRHVADASPEIHLLELSDVLGPEASGAHERPADG